jgi:hypothetical protein
MPHARALDLLGLSSQLVFNTFMNKYPLRLEHAARARGVKPDSWGAGQYGA